MLGPVLVIGLAVAGSDWRKWFSVLGAAYLVWLLFLFLHEINENIRFVRHQLRAFRDAVNEVGGSVERLHRPALDVYPDRANFSIADALEWLNSKWEHPSESR